MIDKFLNVKLAKLSFLEKLWLLAPIVVWFSYWPNIRLGQDTTSSYELSMTLIYLIVLALAGLPSTWGARKTLIKNRAVWFTGSFVLLSLVSLVWTANFTRGFLTAGIIGLLFLVLLAGLSEQKKLAKLAPALAKLFVVSALVMCVLALVQIIVGVWLARSTALLCAGCTANQFGFVRPNVFAIEPQFLGSLLLAPALIVLHAFLTDKQKRTMAMYLMLISSVLFLTLSRGAIAGFIVGAAILFALHHQKVKVITQATIVIIVSLFLALLVQGTAAAVNPKLSVTFRGAVAASVNHLSIGIIDLSAKETAKVSPEPEATNQTEEDNTAPVFSGYVEESTDTRRSLSRLAFDAWADNPTRIMFGVGLGGSGVALHAMYPDRLDESEIVQNEYMEILLEYGALGLVVFTGIIAALFYITRYNKWFWAIIAAYLAQWIFFSGYPNALHIYFVFALLCTTSLFVASKHNSKRLK